MLKITETNGANSTCRLKLEGKLLEPWIDSLWSACGPHESGELICNIELDLAQVTFIDRQSIGALRALIRRGASIVAASAFVSELLKEGAT